VILLHEHKELFSSGSTQKHWAPKLQPLAVLFCLLAYEERTKQGECRALVVNGHMSHPWHRLRPLLAASIQDKESRQPPMPSAFLAEDFAMPIAAITELVCSIHDDEGKTWKLAN
jgi:hypothetical protein